MHRYILRAILGHSTYMLWYIHIEERRRNIVLYFFYLFICFFSFSPSSNSNFYFRSMLLIDLEILFQLELPASSPSVPKSLLYFSLSLSLGD